MRQIGDEFRVDPFAPVKVEIIAEPDLSGAYGDHFKVYMQNAKVTAFHHYCAKKCLNLNAAKMADVESSCLESCVGRYKFAISKWNEERDIFHATLDEVRLNGGDVYDARDI